MLFANENDENNSPLFVSSGVLSYFITEATYLDLEIGRCNGDEQSPMKDL